MLSNPTMVFRSRTLDSSLERARGMVLAHPDTPGLSGVLRLAEFRAATVDTPEKLFETVRWLEDWLDTLELTFAGSKRLRH